MQIHYADLTATSLEELHAVFHDAFSIYEIPLNLTQSQFNYLLERRGYQPEASHGAFLDGKLIGYVINGLGQRDGKSSAYDISTGLLRIHHKKGIAKRLMAYSIGELKHKGVTQYFLEVIKTNVAAYALYQKSGFEINRQLNFYVFPKTIAIENIKNRNSDFLIQELLTPDWDAFQRCWDFQPTWQNSIDSVQRKADKFIYLGAFQGDKMIGYGIIEPHTGDIPQIAVSPEERRKGVGSVLLEELAKRTKESNVRFINADATCVSFKGFVEHLGLDDDKGQYEMVVNL